MRYNRWIAAAAAATVLAAIPATSHAGVFFNISIAPPAIPVYEQPVCPGPDSIWTPGFWQWDQNVGDYYWVPGTWVAAPQPGYLWTPGYWAFNNGFYGWNAGYWGLHIGYYGGVNYGFGFFGHGYEGGYWNNNHFFYNTAISHVNEVNIHNTYVHNVTVVNNVHTSFVGGNGGLQTRPTGGEQAAMRENHIQPTGVQMQHVSMASQNRAQFASVNHGAPQAAAIARPANSVSSFRQGAVAGQAGGTYNPGTQQRGFAGGNAGQFNRGAQTPGTTSAPANRGGYGNQAAPQMTQRPAYQQQTQQQRPGQQTAPQARTPYQQTAPQQQQRPQYQQPVQQARPQVQEARPQQASRSQPENRGGGDHEEHHR